MPPIEPPLENLQSPNEPLLSEQDRERMEAFRRQHATEMLVILFTDLVGSTALKSQMGDLAAKQLDDEHRRLLMQTLDEIGKSQAIKVMGDAWIFVFLKPGDAVRFALRAQAIHRQARASGFPQMGEFRVGIHLGTVIVEEGLRGGAASGAIGDIKGLQADLTARIMSLAAGGQILCSRAVFDDARHSLKGADIPEVGSLIWRSHGLYHLKGRDEPLEVCEVVEEPSASRFIKPIGNEKAKPVETSDEAPGWRPGLDVVLPGTNWVMEGRLGEGGFGEVWLARDRSLPSRKTVFKFCTKKSKVRSLRRELDVFNRLSAPSGRTPPGIIEVLGAHDNEPPYYIQLAYAPGGDLRQWIAGGGMMAPLRVRLDLALQMARALEIVHKAGFVHRDVKPSNFLVEPAEDPNRAPTLKLSDFGIGQEALHAALDAGPGSRADALPGGGARYSLRSQTLAQAAGSYFYIAPELIKRASSTPGQVAPHAETAADIYSLGVALYQLFAGDPETVPGPGLRALDDPILREDVTACLNEDPSARPTAGALIERFERYEARRAAAQAVERARHALEKRRARRIIIAIASLLALATVLGLLSLGLFFQARDYYRRERQASAQARDSYQRERQASAQAQDYYQRERQASAQALASFEREKEARKNTEEELYYAKIYLAQNQIKSYESEKARATLWSCPEASRNIEWGYLLKQCYLDLFTLRRQGQNIKRVRWSPDGRRLAACSATGELSVWDGQTGKCLCAGVTTGCLTDIEFSKDGRRLLTQGYGGATAVWDAAAARPLFAIAPFSGYKYSGVMNADGSLVAAVGEDGMLHIWEAQSGRQLASVAVRDKTKATTQSGQGIGPDGMPHDRLTVSLSFHPSDPSRLATLYRWWSDWDGTEFGSEAAVWDAREGRKRFILKGQFKGAMSTRWSPDGLKLMLSFYKGVMRQWDAKDGSKLAPLQEEGIEIYGREAISPDGARIAATFKNQIRLWDAVTGKRLQELRSHQQDSEIAAIEFRKNGQYLLTAGRDGTIRVWSMKDGSQTRVLQGHSEWAELDINPKDALLVATASNDGAARIWKLADLDCKILGDSHKDLVTDVSLFRDGRKLATASRDGTVVLWDMQSRHALLTLNKSPKLTLFCSASPDGTKLMTGFEEPGVNFQIWDAANGREMAKIKAIGAPLYSKAWSADGSRIATGYGDVSIHIWNAATGEELMKIEGAKQLNESGKPIAAVGAVSSIVFSQDGRSIAFSLAIIPGYSAVWNLEQNRMQCVLKDANGKSIGLDLQDYSTDSARILGISQDQIVVLDAKTGALLKRWGDPGHDISRARFSPDGRRILTESSFQSVLRIWDTQTARERLVVDFSAATRRTAEGLPGWPKQGNCGDYTPNGTALTVRKNLNVTATLLLAPWRAEDLPGDATMNWQARFDLWRDAQARAQLDQSDAKADYLYENPR